MQWEARRTEKAERKRLQKDNVLRKRNEKGARSKKANTEEENAKDGEEEDEDEDEDVDMYEDEWDSEGLNGDDKAQTNGRDDDEGNVD